MTSENNKEKPERNQKDIPMNSIETPVVTPPEESKAHRFFMRLLRWSVGVLIIFGLGMLAAYYFTIAPLRDELHIASNNLTNAENRIAELEKQVEIIPELENRNTKLTSDLNDAQLHIYALQAIKETSFALWSQNEGDIKGALGYLANSSASIQELKKTVDPSFLPQIKRIEARLELSVDGLKNNRMDPAKADLQVLIGDLLELEQGLTAK